MYSGGGGGGGRLDQTRASALVAADLLGQALDSPAQCSRCSESKKKIYYEGVYSGRGGQRREVVPAVCPWARECG